MGVRLSIFLSLSAATIGNGSWEGIFARLKDWRDTDIVDSFKAISSIVSIDRSRIRSVPCQLPSLYVHDIIEL